VTTRGEGSAGAKTGPSGARTPPVASRQSTGSTEHMHSDLLEEAAAAGREGLPGRGSEVGKFWGSGEGVGGGLNFTISDLQGDLEGVGEKLKFWPSRERVGSGKILLRVRSRSPRLRYPEPTPFEPSWSESCFETY